MATSDTYSISSALPRPPRLHNAFIGAALIFGIVALLVILGPIARYSRTFEAEVQSENALRGALALEVALSRAIEREWDSLQAVANAAGSGNLGDMREFADAVPQAGGRIAWAGFANRSGTIVVGTNGTRQGENVGERRWFREGLMGGNIGNVYRASKPRPGSNYKIESLLNLSIPVTNDDGEVIGVYAYNLRMPWLEDYLRTTAEELRLDAFILNRSGDILAQRIAADAVPLDTATIDRLQLNRTQALRTEDQNGDKQVLAIVPNLGTETMPALHWSLVVRMPAAVLGVQGRSLPMTLLMSLVSLAALLVVFTLVFARHFLAPFEQLAETSRAMAEDHHVYPKEFSSSRESSLLSQSLSRLQSRIPD